ncbi:MAG: vWA domain-containing protein [Planctomycetota bacterium]
MMHTSHIIIALTVLVIVGIAEWLHARKVTRVARLAFGPLGRPSKWTITVAPARAIAAALATWGLLFLVTYDPIEIDRTPAKIASNHLLVLLDVSPSMQLKDAGPEADKISRGKRAGEVVQGVLDRLDMENTRISIVVFYTEALPIVQDTFDKEVIRNALDGLPMYTAFESGPTNLQKGLAKAFEIARLWPADSATLLIVTDGDVATGVPSVIPSSIADTIVVGLGDPVKSSNMNGHPSRQDTMGLRQLATRLGGFYHDGNRKHLPSDVVNSLTMIAPSVGGNWSERDLALFAVGLGCSTLAFVGPLLTFFGRPRTFSPDRRVPKPLPKGVLI